MQSKCSNPKLSIGQVKRQEKNTLELAIKNISRLCSDNSDLKCQNSNVNVIWNKTKSKKMGLWSLQSKIFRSYALITLTCSVKCLTQNCYHIALTLSFLSLALFTALAKFRVFDAFEYQVVQKLQRTPFKSFCIFWIFAHFFPSRTGKISQPTSRSTRMTFFFANERCCFALANNSAFGLKYLSNYN